MNIVGKNLLYNLKVLLVEDEDFTREELGRFLKRRVGKLYVASNVKEGLTEYNKHNPDIIITDLKMPVMDGLSATIKIKEMDENACIMAQTAYALASDRERALEAGFEDYLTKSIQKEKLFSIIENKFLMDG